MARVRRATGGEEWRGEERRGRRAGIADSRGGLPRRAHAESKLVVIRPDKHLADSAPRFVGIRQGGGGGGGGGEIGEGIRTSGCFGALAEAEPGGSRPSMALVKR
jgi:hypothetical protein